MKSALTRISLYSETSTAVYKSGRVGKMSRGQLELGQLDGRVKALTRRVKFRPAASFSACLLARTIRADLCNPHGSAEEVCLLREVKGGLECAAARLAVFYLSTHLAPFSILPRPLVTRSSRGGRMSLCTWCANMKGKDTEFVINAVNFPCVCSR